MAAMSEVFAGLAAAGIDAEDLAIRRPTLDEVFMQLTGHGAGAPDTTTTDTEEAA
jgi:ABC-2 type transport system ATP-binding protein